MHTFVNLGAGRCVLAEEIIGLCSASKFDVQEMDPKAVVHDLCGTPPAKTVVFCRDNTVFLTNFAYETIKARVENAIGAVIDQDDSDEDA